MYYIKLLIQVIYQKTPCTGSHVCMYKLACTQININMIISLSVFTTLIKELIIEKI